VKLSNISDLLFFCHFYLLSFFFKYLQITFYFIHTIIGATMHACTLNLYHIFNTLIHHLGKHMSIMSLHFWPSGFVCHARVAYLSRRAGDAWAPAEPQQASFARIHEALRGRVHIRMICSHAACVLCAPTRTSAGPAQWDNPIWPPAYQLRRGRSGVSEDLFGARGLQSVQHGVNTGWRIFVYIPPPPEFFFSSSRYWLISLHSCNQVYVY
jgi:hypothetical protein